MLGSAVPGCMPFQRRAAQAHQPFQLRQLPPPPPRHWSPCQLRHCSCGVREQETTKTIIRNNRYCSHRLSNQSIQQASTEWQRKIVNKQCKVTDTSARTISQQPSCSNVGHHDRRRLGTTDSKDDTIAKQDTPASHINSNVNLMQACFDYIIALYTSYQNLGTTSSSLYSVIDL